MTKKLFSAAAALTLAAFASSPAHATNINLLGGTVMGNGFGNSIVYSTVIGGQNVNLTVTAWSITTASTPRLTAAQVVKYAGNGLGITNSNGNTDSGSPEHAIDNEGWYDFLLFQFDRPVDINSFHIGWRDTDTDATVRYGNAALSGLVNMKQSDFNALLPNSVQVPGGNSIGDRLIPALAGNYNTWTIGASNILDMTTCGKYDRGCTPKATYDYFKIDGIDVTSAVPEPGTWMMMILGIGAVGGAMRRRQKAAVRFDMATA